MNGVVKGITTSCDIPLLPFFYQVEGILTDVFALRYEVYKVGVVAEVDSGTSTMTLCSAGGHKVSDGYYIAPVDTSAFDLGAHEMVWFYTPTDGGTEYTASYRFEVLDPAYFRVSASYKSYVGSDVESLTAYPIHTRQQALHAASREVDRLTGRFFSPIHMDVLHSVRPDSSMIWIDQPIIGVSALTIESAGVVVGELQSYDLSTESVKVFNRHLANLLTPDDRDNPKIQFSQVGNPAEGIAPSRFPSGVKNIRITGAFGYTDPDGGPFGMTPLPIVDVVTVLAYRQLVDPLGSDPFLQNPGRVKMAKTRDQQIAFDTSASSSATMTGDARLDNILLDYFRPTHVGSAG